MNKIKRWNSGARSAVALGIALVAVTACTDRQMQSPDPNGGTTAEVQDPSQPYIDTVGVPVVLGTGAVPTGTEALRAMQGDIEANPNQAYSGNIFQLHYWNGGDLLKTPVNQADLANSTNGRYREVGTKMFATNRDGKNYHDPVNDVEVRINPGQPFGVIANLASALDTKVNLASISADHNSSYTKFDRTHSMLGQAEAEASAVNFRADEVAVIDKEASFAANQPVLKTQPYMDALNLKNYHPNATSAVSADNGPRTPYDARVAYGALPIQSALFDRTATPDPRAETTGLPQYDVSGDIPVAIEASKTKFYPQTVDYTGPIHIPGSTSKVKVGSSNEFYDDKKDATDISRIMPMAAYYSKAKVESGTFTGSIDPKERVENPNTITLDRLFARVTIVVEAQQYSRTGSQETSDRFYNYGTINKDPRFRAKYRVDLAKSFDGKKSYTTGTFLPDGSTKRRKSSYFRTDGSYIFYNNAKSQATVAQAHYADRRYAPGMEILTNYIQGIPSKVGTFAPIVNDGQNSYTFPKKYVTGYNGPAWDEEYLVTMDQVFRDVAAYSSGQSSQRTEDNLYVLKPGSTAWDKRSISDNYRYSKNSTGVEYYSANSSNYFYRYFGSQASDQLFTGSKVLTSRSVNAGEKKLYYPSFLPVFELNSAIRENNAARQGFRDNTDGRLMESDPVMVLKSDSTYNYVDRRHRSLKTILYLPENIPVDKSAQTELVIWGGNVFVDGTYDQWDINREFTPFNAWYRLPRKMVFPLGELDTNTGLYKIERNKEYLIHITLLGPSPMRSDEQEVIVEYYVKDWAPKTVTLPPYGVDPHTIVNP